VMATRKVAPVGCRGMGGVTDADMTENPRPDAAK
jgi:hypothetical protein